MADTATKQLITNSSARCFRSCRRQYKYRYELGLRRVEDAFALRYGTAFHEAVEILEKVGLDAAIEYCRATEWSDLYTPRTLAAQIRAYSWRWADCPFIAETLVNELSFAVPLTNPDTDHDSMLFDEAGKVDAVVLLVDERTAIRETKTISEDPGPNSRYWSRLLIDPQITLYMQAARQLGYDVTTVIYDVCRKPCKEPFLATPPEDRKYKKDGTLYAKQRETDETPEEWEERLYADMIERPDFYLNRKEIPRLSHETEAFAYDIWDTAKDLRTCQLNDRWYRNPGRHCDQCPYFDLCTGLQAWTPGTVPDGFQIVDDIHPELREKGTE
jgi:hypothetical protein